MTKEVDKEYLVRDLGIFELRGLARELGVSSPTTKKREELIDLIIQALNNSEAQNKAKAKRKGRPFKEIASLNDLLNSMTGEDAVSTPEDSYSSVMTFSQEMPNFIDSQEKNIVSNFEGYVRINNTYKCFRDILSNEWVFIRNDKPFYDTLKEGDKIKVKAKSLATDNQHEVIEIVEINGMAFDNYKEHMFQECKEKIGYETLPYGDKLMIKGRRNYAVIDEDIFENQIFEQVYNTCNKENITLVLLGINTSFENQIYLKDFKNIENFTTQYGENISINLGKILDSVNYVHQLISNRKPCLLYILDIMEVIRILEKSLEREKDKDNMKNSVILKIMSCAKAYEDGYTSTILMNYRNYDEKNEFLQSEILRISKEIK